MRCESCFSLVVCWFDEVASLIWINTPSKLCSFPWFNFAQLLLVLRCWFQTGKKQSEEESANENENQSAAESPESAESSREEDYAGKAADEDEEKANTQPITVNWSQQCLFACLASFLLPKTYEVPLS